MTPPSPDESFKALEEHRALADVIAARDAEAARATMERVLGDFPDDVKRVLELGGDARSA